MYSGIHTGSWAFKQLLWVGICLKDNFGWRFSLVSMVSINSEFGSMGLK